MQPRIPVVLASASPRRRFLLDELGWSFDVRPAGIDETMREGEAPQALVERLAREKAVAVADGAAEALVLAADTIVVLGGEVLGKPADADEARVMLGRLSGRTHTVFSGIALAHPASERIESAHASTDVTFAELSASEIADYVATGSPLDKAGAYGIQDGHGPLFIPRIDGDYFNVVGLPLHTLYRLLRERFSDLLA